MQTSYISFSARNPTVRAGDPLPTRYPTGRAPIYRTQAAPASSKTYQLLARYVALCQQMQGTAPGDILTITQRDGQGRQTYFLPLAPYEEVNTMRRGLEKRLRGRGIRDPHGVYRLGWALSERTGI